MSIDALADLTHGTELAVDRAIWLLNVEKIVRVESTPVSLDFVLESGATVAFYNAGPKRRRIFYEEWRGKVRRL